MYKPSTYLVITYFPTYLRIYETYFLQLVTKVRPNINSVEVHSQLSDNGHPVDGALVGAASQWPCFPRFIPWAHTEGKYSSVFQGYLFVSRYGHYSWRLVVVASLCSCSFLGEEVLIVVSCWHTSDHVYFFFDFEKENICLFTSLLLSWCWVLWFTLKECPIFRSLNDF